MEEFTTLETELEKLFEQYSVRLRCLNYLERVASDAERAHLQRQQFAPVKSVVDIAPLERNDPTDMLSLEDSPPEQKQVTFERPERPRASTGGKQLLSKNTKSIDVQETQ